MKIRTKDGIVNKREYNWFLKFIHMFGDLELYITINGETEDLYKKFKNKSGVYMLGDFYIGKSKNIIKRIIEHIIEIYEMEQPKYRYKQSAYVNLDKVKAMNKILNGKKKLDISILSDKESDEMTLIKEYHLKEYPLTNKVGLTKFPQKKEHVPEEIEEDLKAPLLKLMGETNYNKFEHYLKTGETLS